MIIDQVILIIAETFEVQADQLNPGTNLYQVGMSSLRSIELIVRIEEHFGIFVGEEDLNPDNFLTPQTVARLVENKLKVGEMDY